MPDLSLENTSRINGAYWVAGIDEAGRGPLAGPVSAAAVILPHDFTHAYLNDSKKLTERRRDILYEELTTNRDIIWSLAYADVEEIEALNILRATHTAMARAVESLSQRPDYCLIDGLPVKSFPIPSEGVVKGDSISLSIAAASIIAKVSRDRLMVKYAKEFPGYGFERHKGYGTKMHLEALRTLGACPIHRKTFAPVVQALSQR